MSGGEIPKDTTTTGAGLETKRRYEHMTRATADYIKSVYNTQWEHAMSLKKAKGQQTAAFKEQYAYYKGMMEMLQIIASEAYTVRKSVNDYLEEVSA